MSFTTHQQHLLDTCKKAGWGWANYAASVSKQGRCSIKQQQTLERMCRRLSAYRYSINCKSYKHDRSDCESMSMGEFF